MQRCDCDIGEEQAVRREIVKHRPDWVINAAAFNLVDQAESEPRAALRDNALAVRSLAQACRDAGATLLQFSTDYVFDGGKSIPYTERDLPGPRSVYGVSKLAGELFARSLCPKHYVLRVAGIYGPWGRHTRRGNFPEFVLRLAAEGRTLQIVRDRLATPTFGTALAKRSLDVLELGIPFGLYHLAGGETVSWYAFAREVVRAARCSAEIVPVSSAEHAAQALRPRYSALSNARIQAAGIARMPAIEDCLREYMLLRRRDPAGRGRGRPQSA